MNNLYIFDFDSTFIQVESLDVLASCCLANHPEKESRLKSLSDITEQAMSGRYSYAESLKERLALFSPTSTHLKETLEQLKQQVTLSFSRNRAFFKTHADSIYILSGGLIEFVWPIAKSFGLKRSQVFGNRLLYDFEGNILGLDEMNPLAQDMGKVKLARQLNLQGHVYIIGDGYNDYEVKESNLADTFVAFTENIDRKEVSDKADIVCSELEGLFLSCHLNVQHNVTHPKVLLVENIHPVVAQHFERLSYQVDHLDHSLNEEALIERLKDVQLLGIRSKTQITPTLLQQAPSLEGIGAFCIGTNQIALNECLALGIAVFNAPFSNTRSVVELAMGEIILLLRRALFSHNQLFKGHWHKSSHGAHEVRGKTLGIVGYGNIGSQLSVLAENMGMQVLYYDVQEKLPLGNAKPCTTLEGLLAESDVVTLHVDGRAENKGFFTQREFNLMRKGAIFLNLSRGSVVDMHALEESLSSKHLGGVGIDVYEQEPALSKTHYDSPLQHFDNVILTPHIGGSTEEAQQSIGEFVSKNLHAYHSHGATLGSVNFPELSLPTLDHRQRIIHLHHNEPGVLATINGLLAQYQNNIEGQFLKTNEKIGYVITDVNEPLHEDVYLALQNVEHTIKVRRINND